jgi:hypothetical protein
VRNSAAEPGSRTGILALLAFRMAVASLLLGCCLVRPSRGLAQTGSGWSPPATLHNRIVDSYRTTLVSDQFGAAHVVWTLVDEQTYYYSRWDGSAWTVPIDIIARTDAEPLSRPALVAAADGRLHLFWPQQVVWHSWAWASDAADSARAWSVPEAIVSPAGSASGVMDARQDRSGTFHLVYSQSFGDVYYVRSDAEGLVWTDPVPVSRGGGVVTGAPRLDVEPDGRIHVIWDEWPRNGDPAQSSQVYYAHSDNGADWSEPRQLGELANRGGNVLAAEDGTLFLAWQAGIASPSPGRFVQRSRDGGNTWEQPLRFSENRGQSGYPSMALDGQGTLHIVSGEGSYAFWDGMSLSAPLDLRPLPEDTENIRLTVVSGNQVLVVTAPFGFPGPYYSVKELPLPTLPTATPPARPPTLATPSPVASPEATGSTNVPTATAALQNGSATPADRPASSPVLTLMLSVGLSLALVAGVLIAQLRLRRR